MSSDALTNLTLPAWTTRSATPTAVPERKAEAAPQTQAAPAQPVTAAAVANAANAIESYMKSAGRELEFRVDEASGQMVVSVRDATTGDLIRQIPGEAALRMARQLNEGQGDAPSLLDTTV